ncbi:uncharacterized protein ARMOST_10197 [Armillaria ostoyae]|uniref:Uncharacterized protein n=1 Tax=Armillaria ostoyae TaxID=47428 RepID=A0A284RDS1_ARMOS|nr:uncharacterized protein ARMOST_10197 [Armillaria ostoyae]
MATDPLNLDTPDFEWNELFTVDILILSPHHAAAWELRRQDIEAHYNLHPDDRTPMGWYLAAERGDPIPQIGRDATIAACIFHNQDHSDYRPAPGYILRGRLRPRMTREQIKLELAILKLAVQQRDKDAAEL